MSDLDGSRDLPPSDPTMAAPAVATHEEADRHERLAACPNCGNVFAPEAPAPNFCSRCGQVAVLHPPSVVEFAHEFAGHYVAVDGPLWRTLRMLVTRPGELTREYVRGRRRRYVLPLRLYLSASFLFFLAFRLLPSDDTATATGAGTEAAVHAGASAPAAAGSGAREARTALLAAKAAARDRLASAPGLAASTRADRLARLDRLDAIDEGELEEAARTHRLIVPGRVASEKPFECDANGGRWCAWLSRHFEQVVHRWNSDPAAAQAQFTAQWFSSAPYAVFLLQPAFAAMVGLAYRRRRMLFGEHLVFAMHLHAFWFFAGLAGLLLPGALGPWLGLAVIAYTLLAMRRVYAGRWLPTLARATFIALSYGVLIGIASMAITIIAVVH